MVGYRHDMQLAKMAITTSRLRTAFLQQFGDVRRHTPAEARRRLMMLEHKQQPGERIATYTQRFRLIARDARDMAELDRIEHYMNGLAAQFQAVCRTDSEGKDWTSLDSLVSYALGQESRKTQSKGATLAIANTSRPPFRSRPRKQGRLEVTLSIGRIVSFPVPFMLRERSFLVSSLCSLLNGLSVRVPVSRPTKVLEVSLL